MANKEVRVASKEVNVPTQKIEWIVLTKAPIPGKVKTRLIPELGAEGACDLYQQLLQRLYSTMVKLLQKTDSQLALWVAGDCEHPALQNWLSLHRTQFYSQPEIDERGKACDLGQRMAMAVQSSLQRNCIPVLIGVDVPDLDEAYLTQCKHQLADNDLVISPAEDGGYGLLGMKQFHSELFENKDWGKQTVFIDTRRDIAQLNIKAAYLPQVWDVDEIQDVVRFLEQVNK